MTPITRAILDELRATGQTAARYWPPLLWAVATLAGAADAWRFRNAMNPDGVSYLDLADTITSGDWSDVVNGHWSPLYPLLLGLPLHLLRPALEWEFSLVHAVNFGIYLLALAAFAFFLRGLLALRPQPADRDVLTAHRTDWHQLAVATLATAAFVSATLRFINLGLVSPDLLVSAFLYVQFGLLARMAAGRTAWCPCLLLGACVGLGYLAKAPLLPIGLTGLLCGLAILRTDRQGRRKCLCAAVLAVLVAGPWALLLSLKKGRPTFSDSLRLTYMWHVNRAELGHRLHPLRILHRPPPVYEFATPITGTYPPWRDPSYWTEGLRPRLDWHGHWRQLRQGLHRCGHMLVDWAGGSVPGGLALLALAAIACQGTSLAHNVGRYWFVLVPCLAGLAMFGLVLVEPRYVCGLIISAATALFCGLWPLHRRRWTGVLTALAAAWVLYGWLASSPRSIRLCFCLAVLGLYSASRVPRIRVRRPLGSRLVLGAPMVVFAAGAAWAAWQSVVGWGQLRMDLARPGADQQAARRLLQLGLRPGDWIAVIGGPSYGLYWPRLARLHIAAEVLRQDAAQFWSLPLHKRRVIYDRLRSIGVGHVVAIGRPAAGWGPPWQELFPPQRPQTKPALAVLTLRAAAAGD